MNIKLKEKWYKPQHKHSCKVRVPVQSMIIQFFFLSHSMCMILIWIYGLSKPEQAEFLQGYILTIQIAYN